MTKLYEEATQLLKDMGDDDIIQVVQYIRMIKLSKNNDKNKSMKAFEKLQSFRGSLPKDFDYESVLNEEEKKSMVILVDTSIILDVLEERENFVEQSSKILEMCAQKIIKGYIAFHSVSNIFFILRKKYSKSDRRELLKIILDILEVTGASHSQVRQAVEKEYFDDFEDCLQDECAKAVKADYIITRNKTDFSFSDTKAVTPEEFLEVYWE